VTIETDGTDYPTCPHCGAVYTDVWEWPFDGCDQYETECDCGKSFVCDRFIGVTYSTRATPPAEVK
jgi:hypothetical protein